MPLSIEEFERGATALRELEEASVCRVVILSPYGPQFVQFIVLRDDPRAEQVLESHGLDAEALEAVTDEVAEALTAVINDAGPDRFARLRARRRTSREEPGEADPEDAEKYRIAERTFDVSRLKARAWIKQTAKDLLPVTVEWEIADKVADDDVPRPSETPVRFATVRIVGGSADFDPFQAAKADLSLTVDREDVLVMLDILTRLRDAFSEADQ